MISWIYLVLAGLFEIGWAIGIKSSHGFTRLVPSLITVTLLIASLGLLSLALRQLPMGTAYGVWTGIGTIGTALIGMAFFGESKDWPRVLCLVMIAAGIVGLKLFSKES